MRRLTWILLAGLLLVVACAPAATPTATALPPTPVISPTSAPVPSEAPTLAPVALAGPQAGTSMVWLDGAVLLYVPTGDFVMGTGIGSTPQKTVTLDGYWIYSTDVTNKMYAQCVGTGNCAPPAQEIGAPVFTNPQYGDYPIVGVTWDMADNYCKWSHAQLPTEAQWEKAARGQNSVIYPWGVDSPSCDLLNYQGCVGHVSSVTGYAAGRSPYGAFDMAGNVFQWVRDFYDEHYYDSMPSQNPTGPASGNSHTVRGSSFETEAALLLSGARHFGASAYHSSDLSFRCSVDQPKAFAPYCQLSSYIPTGAGPSNTACQVPQPGVERNYCTGRVGYATLEIPSGATYRTPTKGYSCTDAVVDGHRILTCTGPDDSSGDVILCNAACSGAPTETGAPVACDPGYTLDTAPGTCTYAPISSQPGTTGCPQGYNLLDRGGQKICTVGLSQNGQCTTGTYFDGQYGACVSPSGSPAAPYGINDPALASQSYQGCAAGYSYDPNNQCCQAKTGGAYPGCPLGFAFDSTKNTCVPQQVRLSGPGCVTVSLYTAKCAESKDVCSIITNEAPCRRNPACQWDDRKGLCTVAKPQP